jgi:hypothetical protein
VLFFSKNSTVLFDATFQKLPSGSVILLPALFFY